MIRPGFLLLFFCLATSTSGQLALGDWTIHPPVDLPMKLSGTFAELRGNHFHGGIDLKSKSGAWGDPIYAVDDGYICRVRISAGSFGHALYINHPNGITSVYAHLQGFTDNVEVYIRKLQRSRESFEITDFPGKEQFPVKKGEMIGRMGSTGYSFGTHLHFELRNSKTERTINPLHYLDIADNVNPVINQIVLYSLDENLDNFAEKKIAISQLSGRDTFLVDAPNLGIGVVTHDPFNGGRNKNGIYGITIECDKKLNYNFSLDSIATYTSRDYYAHIDYRADILTNRKIHKCYRHPSNELEIYNKECFGVIHVSSNRAQKIDITVKDIGGNKKTVSLWIRSSGKIPERDKKYSHYIKCGWEANIEIRDLNIYFPEDALYEDGFFDIYSSMNNNEERIYHVHENVVPLKEDVTIKINPVNKKQITPEKMLIASIDRRENITGLASKWDGGWLSARTGKLGDFKIIIDTISPDIQLLSNRNTSDGKIFVFRIDDNIDHQGGLKYRATLNGKWLLADYDLKSKRIHCNISNKEWAGGPHHFKLEVTDAVGNKKDYISRFIF